MNLLPGGKQPQMRNTVFPTHPATVQYMVFQPNDTEIGLHRMIPNRLIGQPKGMKRILQERGLWVDGLRTRCPGLKRKAKDETEEQYTGRILLHKACWIGDKRCAYRIMEGQEDFIKERSLLEIEITARGHECIFYPKFHCELNYIEFFWGAVKRYTRQNCNYSFVELEDTVRAGLGFVSLTKIRRFANRSRRWIDAYIDGLNDRQQAFVEGREISHRRGMGENLV